MTLQLRPTFSESWYRVANLRAKLRSGAQISRQFYRGERWYVVRDPAGNQYHRLSDAAYRFVGLLDGTRTIEEAWELVGGTLEDDAPTQPEVIQILSHLYSANLIDADVTPDATVLLRRHKQLGKRKMQNRLMNALFPRIPLWDPDRFLKRWMPLAKICFSRVGAIVWIAVIALAVWMLVPYWSMPNHSLQEAAKYSVDLTRNPLNVVLLWAVFVFIKLIHELGHAFSCRRFGGECHELGVMFLVFIPTPYVDASSAWSFRNKWQRIFVGAAGMIVELFFAALCSFIWIHTGDIHSIVAQLSFNAMLVASVTTIIFNANPLLRYDGYYILSDFLEIPNLRQKSTEYALGLIKRHIFGVKLQQPLPPVIQRLWLFAYAVLSSIYRTFVGVVIILLVAFQIPVLGALMAIGGLVTWLVMPVFQIFKYLAIEPELHRKRLRASLVTGVFAAAMITVIGFVPWSTHEDSLAVAEVQAHESVRGEYHGFIRQIVAHDQQLLHGPARGPDGSIVKPGDVILIAQSPELDKEIAVLQSRIRQYNDKWKLDLRDNPADADTDIDAISAIQKELDDRLRLQNSLTIRAPIDGRLIAPGLSEKAGSFFHQGEELATMLHQRFEPVAVPADGVVADVMIKDGATVNAGDVLFTVKSADGVVPVKAPLSGQVDVAHLDALAGKTVKAGEIGDVFEPEPLNIRVLLDQNQVGMITEGDSINPQGDVRKVKAYVRLASDISTVLEGGPPQLRPAATDTPPGPQVTQKVGEDMPVNPQHPDKLMNPQFEVDVTVPNPQNKYVPGQKAWVRFKLAPSPLAEQWWRKILRLIQTKQQNPLV